MIKMIFKRHIFFKFFLKILFMHCIIIKNFISFDKKKLEIFCIFRKISLMNLKYTLLINCINYLY